MKGVWAVKYWPLNGVLAPRVRMQRQNRGTGENCDVVVFSVVSFRKPGVHASRLPQHGSPLDAPGNLLWEAKTYKQ